MVWSMLCVRIIEYMRLRGHSLRVYKGYIEYAFAFELFEGMVKVYGVCVWISVCVLGMRLVSFMRLVDAFALGLFVIVRSILRNA